MTRYSSAAAAGRQLLILKSSLARERDPAQIRQLRRKEVRILLSLGQVSQAADCARKLSSDYSEWPVAHSIHADLCCRRMQWMEAAEEFEKAAMLHRESGEFQKAAKIMLGPLFRLAEAGEDYGRCLELSSDPECGGTGRLASVLHCRALRIHGQASAVPDGTFEDDPAAALALLERAWRGRSPRPLLASVNEWHRSEPEWRWRVMVEGVGLWLERNLDLGQWRRPLKNTDHPVADPRYTGEKRWLYRIVGKREGRQ